MRGPLYMMALVVLLAACKTSTLDPSPEKVGYTYWPTNSGSFVVYKVVSSDFKYQQAPNTNAYLLKEVIGDTFTDDRGQQAYRLMRFRYPDTTRVPDYNTLAWTLDSVWVLRLTNNCGIKVENNLPIVKLSFPLRENLSWNANLYNQFGTSDPLIYRARELGQAITVNGNRFSKSVRVAQANSFSCLGQDLRNEWYAEGVGLVLKNSTNTVFKSDSCNNVIIQGRSYSQSWVANGNQ